MRTSITYALSFGCEGIAAIAFVPVYLKTGFSMELMAGWVLTSILIAAAFIDGQLGLIPNRLTYTGVIIGWLFSPFTIGIKSGLIGMFFYAACFSWRRFCQKGEWEAVM